MTLTERITLGNIRKQLKKSCNIFIKYSSGYIWKIKIEKGIITDDSNTINSYIEKKGDTMLRFFENQRDYGIEEIEISEGDNQ